MWADLGIPGALSEAECDALHHLAGDPSLTNALEVGHLFGLSTAVLLQSLPEGCAFTTVDHHRGDPWTCATNVAEVAGSAASDAIHRASRFADTELRRDSPLPSEPV